MCRSWVCSSWLYWNKTRTRVCWSIFKHYLNYKIDLQYGDYSDYGCVTCVKVPSEYLIECWFQFIAEKLLPDNYKCWMNSLFMLYIILWRWLDMTSGSLCFGVTEVDYWLVIDHTDYWLLTICVWLKRTWKIYTDVYTSNDLITKALWTEYGDFDWIWYTC